MSRGEDAVKLQTVADELFGVGVWTDAAVLRVLSSVELMRFLVRLEKEFDISIPDDELRPDNFVSLSAVRGMLERSGRA